MWKLTLCLSLLTANSFGAGLIQVPDSAVVKPSPSSPAPGMPRTTPLTSIFNGPDLSGDLPTRLDGASQAEYEHYFNTLFLYEKQAKMAAKALTIPPVPGVKCLEHKDAFGFERVSETDYKMNCFAGTGKRISHLADYRMNLVYLPEGCASEAAVKAKFADATNRNRRAAAAFYSDWKRSCIIQAYPSSNLNAAKATPITTEFVNKTLEKNAELDKYVNGSRSSVKKPYTPADDDEPVVVKPSKKKPVVSDDSDSDEPKRPAPCIPGNIFCSKSAD